MAHANPQGWEIYTLTVQDSEHIKEQTKDWLFMDSVCLMAIIIPYTSFRNWKNHHRRP